MKKIITYATAMLFCGGMAWGEDFTLSYVDSDGVQHTLSWDASTLQKITFTDGQMNVITTENVTTNTVSLSDIQSIELYNEEYVANGIKTVTEPTDKSKACYDLMGRRLATELDQLPKGIYIIDGKKKLIK
ncbi:MAG: hypothetical protein IJP82_10995 [Bacteroidaceae bacterium]|nr:hypothetical protein [Bacteroidaceae bacterium]